MKATAEKDALFTLLGWHSKTSPAGLVQLSVAEHDAPLVIESASSDNGWQRSTLNTTASEPGTAAFSALRTMAQRKLSKRAAEVTLDADDTHMVSRLGRSTATSPLVIDVPEFWRPEPTPDGRDPFTVIAEVETSELAWMLRAGDAMRSQDPAHPTHAATLVVEGTTVALHATDGYRMGFAQIESLIPGVSTHAYISPSALLAPVSVMGQAQTVDLIATDGHIGVRGAGTVMARATTAAGPPPMEKLQAQAAQALEQSPPVQVPVSEFADAVTGVGLGKNGSTLVEVGEDYLTVSSAASSSEMEGSTRVDVEANVPDGAQGSTFKINAANAAAALKQMRCPMVSVTRTSRMVVLAEPEGPRPFMSNISLVQ